MNVLAFVLIVGGCASAISIWSLREANRAQKRIDEANESVAKSLDSIRSSNERIACAMRKLNKTKKKSARRRSVQGF